MIIDDKVIMFPPPPPYLQSPPSPSLSYASSSLAPPGRAPATLTSLPSHILLQIIHHTLPPLAASPVPLYEASKPERQRKTLFWLAAALRLVSRRLYTACMHVLRSTYLPAYTLLVRAPYTSDPFPLSLPESSAPSSGAAPHDAASPATPSSPRIGPPAYTHSTTSLGSLSYQKSEDTSPLLTIHRETPVLDRFIALKVRQDVFADDTELHIDREDAFRDLFDVAQPRARLEDLVRVYGVREGVVSVPGQVVAGTGAGHGQGREGGGGERVYGSPSQSSSLISLLSPKTSASQQTTPSSSSRAPQTPTSTPTPTPTPKPRRSLFSFIKSSSSPQNPTPSPRPPTQTHPQPQITPLPFSSLSISFSPRRVGLVLNRSRTIAEVPRLGVGRNKEPLEALARALVGELRVALGG